MNNFEIKKSELSEKILQVFNVKQLVIDSSFEKKFAQHKIYIIAENLEIFTELQ